MKNFSCDCGRSLFFDSTRCLSCDSLIGFDPETFEMHCLQAKEGALPGIESHILCQNGIDYEVCNWLTSDSEGPFCIACNLNTTIPDLSSPNRLTWWKKLERAKHRLIYTLLSLKLPFETAKGAHKDLRFQFIEDQRTNPNVSEEFVTTGHLSGLITINAAEADSVLREETRQLTGELYRTLLGNFRHESGHYFFEGLLDTEALKASFRELFGDEREDYQTAIERYYARTPDHASDPSMISLYAMAHPLEDFAECWAHYLHMIDTLDTASNNGIAQSAKIEEGFDAMLRKWTQLIVVMNELNRSMGLEDPYPFTLSAPIVRKLRFVHDLVCPSSQPRTGAASA